jgi:hypothetical protein
MRAMPPLQRLLIALVLALALPLQALAVAGALPCAMHDSQTGIVADALPDMDAAEAPCHEIAIDATATDPAPDSTPTCSLCKLCTAVSALPATPVALSAQRAAGDPGAPLLTAAPAPRPERLERPPRSALPA